MKRDFSVAAILTLLLLSIGAYELIPFWSFWGLDLHNLLVFHNCQHANQPYGIEGAVCGDAGNRPMYYPPLLYFSFFWLRGLSLPVAIRIWSILLILFMLLLYRVWFKLNANSSHSMITLIFWILLLAQYPFVFSVERGNSDIGVLLLWSLAAHLFVSERYFQSGIAMAAAVLYKVYPAIPLAFIIAALLPAVFRDAEFRKRVFYPLLGGGIAGAVLFAAPLYSLTLEYFVKVLPLFAGQSSGVNLFSHSLDYFDSLYAGLSYFLKALLTAAWLLAGAALIRTQPALLFAGLLAVSTYYAGTTYDYNLITAYPFFLVLFCRAKNVSDYLWIFWGLLGVIGNRHWWGPLSAAAGIPAVYLWLQVIWFILIPLWLSYRHRADSAH